MTTTERRSGMAVQHFVSYGWSVKVTGMDLGEIERELDVPAPVKEPVEQPVTEDEPEKVGV